MTTFIINFIIFLLLGCLLGYMFIEISGKDNK